MDANAPEILETLQTLIAPGNQVRLSPYVEAMQFQLLFGKKPDPNKRFESARAILDTNQQRVQSLAACWSQFEQSGKVFQHERYDNEFLDAYLAYYLTVNVGKLQILFIELLRQYRLPPRFCLLDVGIASGTTFVALLDFLAAWESACRLHDTVFPIESVELIGVDARRDCLDYSRKVVRYLADLIESSAVSELPFTDWVDTARWVEHDVTHEPLTVPDRPALLVCSNVLNELADRGHEHVVDAIRQLPDQSMVLLLEPGDRKGTQALNRWRSTLLDNDASLHLLGPCGSEHSVPVPAQCANCWNARRESLHRPLLYQQFCEEAAKVGGRENPKWQQEYENNLLSWSYLCIVKTASPLTCLELSSLPGEITTRFIGRYRSDNENVYQPAVFEEEIPVANEKIKFCPAACSAEYKVLTLYRKNGFTLPPIGFGQAVRLIGIQQQQSRYRSEYLVNAESVDPVLSEPPARFLQRYSESTRKGIDAIAHRLFGFPAMREFQHQILERVLSGHSIFAIAATGGGKSECYILPAMLLPGLTVVISPLKSLMQDQYDQRLCARYGLGSVATFVNSSIPFRERENRIRRMELGYYKLVYLTPEQCAQSRMLDSLRRAHERIGFRFLALDEAHCISHWGHDFRPAYLNLLKRFQDQGLNPVRIALTATASPQVRKDICDELSLNPDPIEQGGDLLVYSANRPELNLIVKVTDTVAEKVQDIEDRLRHLLRENRQGVNPGAAIVFMPYTGPAETKSTDYQGRELDYSGRRTVAHFASHLERSLKTRVGLYHGKMEDESEEPSPEKAGESAACRRIEWQSGKLGEIRGRDRRSEQERFIQGKTDIMVATKGFGMGIDKANIRCVLHHTTPGNLEAYTQEAGRAGRDGELADVVLYFSPQAVDNSGGHPTADGEVQRFFLEQKYIREIDVRAIWDFLICITRQPEAHHRPGKVYFTADQVMGHFDALVGEGRYQWPKFPKREVRGNESSGHATILDQGHLYQKRSEFIDRILSVCYRIRPVVGDRHRTLLDEMADVGASLKGGCVVNANAIIDSNERFAEILRKKGLNAGSLHDYLTGDKELFPLAARLDLSLQDTASLLQDVKKADGKWQGQPGKRKWRSNLLEFLVIVAPKWGPAQGKESLWTWRAYAGAKERATKSEAERRAKAAGRDRPTDDDYFFWKELPYTKSWEVTLGDVFAEPNKFDAYLKAFLSIHDQRRDEDNRAYQLLLRDYIGVTEEGRRLSEQGGCLRVVMLGYLKTNETVIDGNCGGCSICCPDEQFQTDLAWRKTRIVNLSEALSQFLAGFERGVSAGPTTDILDDFWEQVAIDEQAGRAVIGYLRGWTNRLISETPSHVSAYWLRVDGMLRRRFPVVESDLLHDLDRLRELITPVADLLRLADMLAQSSEHIEASKARFDLIRARLMQRLGRAEAELDAWVSLLDRSPNFQLKLEANRALATLFASDGPLPDAKAQRAALSKAVEADSQQAQETMEPYLADWNFGELADFLGSVSVDFEVLNGLVMGWLARNQHEPKDLLGDVLSTLNEDGYSSVGAAISRAVQPKLLDCLEALSTDGTEQVALLCRMEPYITCNVSRWLWLAAERFDHLGQKFIAKEYWETLLALAGDQSSNEFNPTMAFGAARNLTCLFAVDGPYPNGQRHREALIAAIDNAAEQCTEIVEPYAAHWNVLELCDILTSVPDESQLPILSIWFRTAQIDVGRLIAEIGALVEGHAGLQAHPLVASRLVYQLFAALSKNADAMFQRGTCVDPAAARALANSWLTDDCRHLGSELYLDLDMILWRLLQSADRAEATVIGRVIERVNGGFSIDLGGVQGFLPNSHSNRLRYRESSRVQMFEFKILESPQRRDRHVVLSRTKLAEQRLAEMEIGQHIEGQVSAIVDYGAFVDLGGFDGLLHKNAMRKERGAVPSEILTEGQRIAVLVTDIDRERNRVSLRLFDDGEHMKQGKDLSAIPGVLLFKGLYVSFKQRLRGKFFLKR